MDGITEVLMAGGGVNGRTGVLVKNIPGFSALVPIANRFADHAQYLRGEYLLQVEILELKDQIGRKNELNAIAPLRILLPAALDVRTPNDDQAQGFIARRSPR